jgi:hypothetical protein
MKAAQDSYNKKWVKTIATQTWKVIIRDCLIDSIER